MHRTLEDPFPSSRTSGFTLFVVEVLWTLSMDKKFVEAELKAARFKTVKVSDSKFKSQIWKKFSRIQDGNNKDLNFVACNTRERVYPYSATTGTTGLKKHTCNRRDSAATSSGMITSFVNVSRVPQSSKRRFSSACSAFIAEDLRPYNIVAGNGFSKLIRAAMDIGASGGKIQASDIIPNRKTVESRTKTLAASAREKVNCN